MKIFGIAHAKSGTEMQETGDYDFSDGSDLD